ncbi:MAG: carbohydrate kinase family protein, partial [Melioribacteraceae bacterium]
MNFRITSIGEILHDVYPEYKKLGGAPFNFIYHVWKLNGQGNFVSRVGDDKNGREILKFLKSKKFDCKNISFDPHY